MRARVAQATVRVWVEGRDDPCSLTVLVDPEGVDLSRPECFSPRAFMKSPSIYKRVRVRGKLSIPQLSIKPAGNCLPTSGYKATIKGIMASTKAVPLKRKSHTNPARRRTSPVQSVIGRDLKPALQAIDHAQTCALPYALTPAQP